ncbi:hypothetical protein CHS0354_029137 [Potamilus streckersoni]|uniref:Uncharacterized protein n=1 Tax=Potamilus streckersoni TaxID=2493646 RepID=A0AAE0SXN0_9BIVA|nr:hypothetical protein CHS0354_029137 [Potamilus streckersoni]
MEQEVVKIKATWEEEKRKKEKRKRKKDFQSPSSHSMTSVGETQEGKGLPEPKFPVHDSVGKTQELGLKDWIYDTKGRHIT